MSGVAAHDQSPLRAFRHRASRRRSPVTSIRPVRIRLPTCRPAGPSTRIVPPSRPAPIQWTPESSPDQMQGLVRGVTVTRKKSANTAGRLPCSMGSRSISASDLAADLMRQNPLDFQGNALFAVEVPVARPCGIRLREISRTRQPRRVRIAERSAARRPSSIIGFLRNTRVAHGCGWNCLVWWSQ